MTKEQLLAMSADDYMNADQLAFFTELLQAMKVCLLYTSDAADE